MARSVRAASCVFVTGVVLLLPSPAVALPPTCKPATVVTPVNTRLVLAAAVYPCTDPEGDPYAVAATTRPGHGTLGPNDSYYDPAHDFHNVDFFSYQATDSHNEPSAVATITIIVDSAPVCTDGAATTQAEHAITIPDFPCSDVDGAEFALVVTDGEHGKVTVDHATEAVTYLPDPGFVGTDSFSFWAEDDFGQLSEKRKLAMTVTKPLPVPTPVPPPDPGGYAPAPPPDKSAPAVTIRNATAKQAVSFAVTTDETASARFTVSIDRATARKLKLSRTVGTLSTALRTRTTTTVSIRLSAKTLKAFKRVKQVRLTLTAVVTDVAGNATTRTLVLTFRR